MKSKNGKTMAKSKVIPKPQSLGESFAANLRYHRAKLDVSQSGLAARAGVTTGHISMLERGTRNPSFEVIEHVAAALNVRDPRKMFEARKAEG
jgi:transcriptional regulator with XRE-family HTH domain